MDTTAAEAFIDGYRSTFESRDVAAIADRFAFPCQVIGQADGVTVVVVPDVATWTASIERIVGAYRLLGVVSAVIESLQVVEVTPGIAHAVVRWNLKDAAGGSIYAFTASYSLIDTAAGPRITAIAHDEGPLLARAVAAAASARPA
jgi:hypothetical protein